MKKIYFSIFLTIFLGLHLCSLDILAQSCSQLGLPENALARLCRSDGGVAVDLDYSPDGKTLASVLHHPRKIVLWDIDNKDCVVNIQDLVLVASNFGGGGDRRMLMATGESIL